MGRLYLRGVWGSRLAVVALVLVLGALDVPLGLAEEDPPPPGSHFTLPFLETPDTDPQVQQATPASSYVSWSRMATQSYRDGNWEIYIRDDDGSAPVRLTNSSTSDIQPDLNRGATKIVYAGYAGDYEIRVVNSDGSGDHALTDNTAMDIAPSWSPDSAWIAFQSNRDGQHEVYIMRADGTQQTRLTHGGGYNGEPAWSPDGQQLAYVSRSSGDYRIWVMNLDGTGQRQLNTPPNSANPAWAPGGTTLLLDADSDGDGWHELWRASTGDMFPTKIAWTIDGRSDIQAGSWSPDGRYASYTVIELVQYSGTWYWTRARLRAWDPLSGGTTPVDLGYDQRDWGPSWNTTDNQPSIIHVKPLPEFSSLAIFLNWINQEVGPAGLRLFEVQKRDHTTGGDWEPWRSYHNGQSADYFYGEMGHRYGFRVRATDAAFNVSPWTPEVSTTLYARQVSGTVVDNRLVPLPGVGIVATPNFLTPLVTNAAGQYAGHSLIDGLHSLRPEKAGYGQSASITQTINTDIRFLHLLPPEDDLLDNGGFEALGDGLAGWQAVGTRPAEIRTNAPYSGVAAAFLGASLEPQLLPRDVIDGGYDTDPDFAVGDDGVIHMVSRNPPHRPETGVFYRRRNPDGQWSVPVKIDPANNAAVIGVSPSGDVHTAWTDGYGTYYRMLPASGDWTPPIRLSGLGVGLGKPEMVVDRQGGVHISHARAEGNPYPQIAYSYRSPSGEWASPVFVANGYVSRLLALGPDDVPHIVTNNTASSSFRHCERPSPSTPEVWQCEDISSGNAWRLAVTPNNQVHVIAQQGSFPVLVFYAQRTSDGTWTSELLPWTYGYAPGSMVSDHEGVLHALHFVNGNLGLSDKRIGEGWSGVFPVNPPGRDIPSMAVDSQNKVHVMYEAGLDVTSYQVKRDTLTQETSALRQTLTLPVTIHQPTLSMMYQVEGVSPGGPGGFSVTIADAVTETVAYMATQTTSDWTPAWVDLSPWRGQTITITLASTALEPSRHSHVYLDALSVGAWLTPVPQAVDPGLLPAMSPGVLTITGQNFIFAGGVPPQVRLNNIVLTEAQWLTSTTLKAAYPALAPGRYALIVSNPGGQEAALAEGLRVGYEVNLPLIRR